MGDGVYQHREQSLVRIVQRIRQQQHPPDLVPWRIRPSLHCAGPSLV